jgi:hypothetical protein
MAIMTGEPRRRGRTPSSSGTRAAPGILAFSAADGRRDQNITVALLPLGGG